MSDPTLGNFGYFKSSQNIMGIFPSWVFLVLSNNNSVYRGPSLTHSDRNSKDAAHPHSRTSKIWASCSPSLTLTHALLESVSIDFFFNFAPIFLAKSLDCREISKWVSWWKKKKPDLQWGLLIDPAGPFAEKGKRHAHLSSWRHWNDFWKRVSHKQHSCPAKILFFSNKSSQ
jgi:hypothetical protein